MNCLSYKVNAQSFSTYDTDAASANCAFFCMSNTSIWMMPGPRSRCEVTAAERPENLVGPSAKNLDKVHPYYIGRGIWINLLPEFVQNTYLRKANEKLKKIGMPISNSSQLRFCCQGRLPVLKSKSLANTC